MSSSTIRTTARTPIDRTHRATPIAPALLAAVVAAIALFAGLLVPGAASAAPDDAATDGTIAEDAQLLIVLDSSSSMLEPATDGGTRADAAKDALLGVVDTLEEGQRVGLRQFGAEVVGLDDPASCTDSQLTVPVAADNRDALRAAANAYLPYGETPIGYALEQAGADLGTEGQRTILLISDGESNCEPDPCDVAADLAAQGIDLTIHVVGFDVSGAARDALVCIANAGGGQYFDVSDTTSLTDVFERVSTRAFREFALDGEPVTGTVDAASAPTLTPGTRYITYLPAIDQTLNYVIERTIPGSQLRISINATVGISAQAIGGDLYAGTTTEGASCGVGLSFPTTWGGTWSLDSLHLTSDTDDECASADTLLLTLENWLGSEPAEGAPAEVIIFEEPPVSSTAGLPEVPESPAAWVDPPASTPEAILGGSTLSDNPELTNGTYTFDLLNGETVLFHTYVDWGQSLQVRTESEFGIDMTLFAPDRTTSNEYNVGASSAAGDDPTDEVSVTAIKTLPITYLAREDWTAYGVDLAGEYTYAVTRNDCTTCSWGPEALPVTMEVFVEGEVSGVPAYVGAAATSTAEPTDSSASPSADPESASATGSADDGEAGADSGGGLPAGVPIALGVAGAGLLGVGAWMLKRRRGSQA